MLAWLSCPSAVVRCVGWQVESGGQPFEHGPVEPLLPKGRCGAPPSGGAQPPAQFLVRYQSAKSICKGNTVARRYGERVRWVAYLFGNPADIGRN